jgi:hypothetical protein
VCDVAVVSWPSPRSDRGAACSAESAASRALCVLRDNRERAVASCFPIRGAADLAQVEALAVEQGTQDMGVVDAALGAVSSAAGLRGSFDLSSWSEPVIRGAGSATSRTSGSVGGRGERSPWSTRHAQNARSRSHVGVRLARESSGDAGKLAKVQLLGTHRLMSSRDDIFA